MLDGVFAFAIFILALWYWKRWSHPENFPPGPKWPLPLIGDGHLLGSDLKSGFVKFRRKYGNVCGFWLGKQRTVIISDFAILQEILNKPETADRRPLSGFSITRGGQSLGSAPGVLFSNGSTWIEMRRTSLHILRDFGYGKNAIEEIIDDEIDNLIHYIDDNYVDLPLDVSQFFNIAVLASLWRVISGECLKVGDPKLEHLIQMVTNMSAEIGKPLTTIALDNPLLLKIIHAFGISKFIDYNNSLLNFNIDVIKKHQTKHIDGENPLTFTEAMLHKISNTSDINSPLHDKVGELNLVNVLLDLFLAGSDTTSVTLNWAMLYMILNPDVQEKVRQELNEVYGGQKPSTAKRSQTPYTEAVLHEIQRQANIAPFALLHFTSAKVNIGDFSVPPKTILVPMIGEIMNDPEHFPDPAEFNPERYLANENGKLVFKPHPRVIPFGIGKRRCLGESLAKVSLYKFFCSLIAKYDIVSGQGKRPISTERQGGVISAPVQYFLMFKERKHLK